MISSRFNSFFMKNLLAFSIFVLCLAGIGITGCSSADSTTPVTGLSVSATSSPVTLTSKTDYSPPIVTLTPVAPSLPGAPSAAELAKQQFALPNIPRLTVEQVYALWDSNAPLVLIDVRQKEFYNDQHIPGARNIPNGGGETQPVSTEALAQLTLLPKDRPLVFYCD
jgi:hypothetical protein